MKKHYRIKQRCMIGLNLYEPGQEIFIDEEKFSKSLMEPAEAEASVPEETNAAANDKRDEKQGEAGDNIPDEKKTKKETAEEKDEAGKDAAGDNDAAEKDITDHKNKMMNTKKPKPFKNPFRKKKKK